MLKNYFITAVNNLLKNKLYSAINIIGLAVGLAACLLITLYVKSELSYDRHWEKPDHIFRINFEILNFGHKSATTFDTLLPDLRKYFSEDIEIGTRIGKYPQEMQIGETICKEMIAAVDKDFTNLFQCEVLEGNLEKTFQGPGNIAISEDFARRYFGNKNPVGEIIEQLIDFDKVPFNVTAVYRMICPKTVLDISAFHLLEELPSPETGTISSMVETYIRFKETTDIDKFSARLPNFIDETLAFRVFEPNQKASDLFQYSLQKMTDIYFNPYSDPGRQSRSGNRALIAVYITISALLLVIGCINFILLTTAKATQRAREIAIRKVLGARYKALLLQFLGESLLITLIAFIIALAMTELALPFFELLMGFELAVPYSAPESYIFALFLITLVGLLGGLYPALILSRFSPNWSLKTSHTTETIGSLKLRKTLVIFQFTVSIVLIIATAVAYFQLLYTRKHDPGFNPDNLLVVENIGSPKIGMHRKTLKQELLKIPEVINAGLSTIQPTEKGNGVTLADGYRRKTSQSELEEQTLTNIFVDFSFFETYGISLLSGRYFTGDIDQEESIFGTPQKSKEEIKAKRIIVNLAAARQLGYTSAKEAVGGIIIGSGPKATEYLIIGVVEDTQYRNLRTNPDPEIYRLIPDYTQFMTVRYRGDYQTVFKEVKRVWHEVVGDFTFKVSNVKQNMAATFVREENETRLLNIFALLAVFIACIGLLGIAEFTVERRTKEIGLRKVMGANIKEIVRLLSWQFLKPVLIANIIAWPVAIFAMQNWLERFPYRFNPLFMIPVCLCSGLIALAIAWFTVAGNTTRAARKNPIHSLRYE